MEWLEWLSAVLDFVQGYWPWILAALGMVSVGLNVCLWKRSRNTRKALMAVCAGIEESSENSEVKNHIKKIAKGLHVGSWLYSYVEKYINSEKYKKILKKILT